MQAKRYGDQAALKKIDGVRDAHVAAINSGDAGAWTAQFAEDAIQMPPHSGANIGKAQIGGWSKGFLDAFRVRFSLAVDEVRVLDDWAFEVGKYEIALSPAEGPEMADQGKYVTLYQRDGEGAWKMARDIWNSSRRPFGA